MPNDKPTDYRAKAASGAHLWLVLWKATRALEAVARHDVERPGICLSDFAVLEALLHKGPLPVNALGAKVLLTSGSMTAAVDRLERRRLVKRRADAEDRSARVVHLTARGERLILAIFASHAQSMEVAVAVLSGRERATLVALLRKLGLSVEDKARNSA
jgi:MarR family 2-MHQ and catechol resistance regulon transcriptional repressor